MNDLIHTDESHDDAHDTAVERVFSDFDALESRLFALANKTGGAERDALRAAYRAVIEARESLDSFYIARDNA